MKNIDLAYKYVRENRPEKAILEFEAVVKRNAAELEDYIELAMLYFQCYDPGYSGFYKIPDSIMQLSFDRPFELLECAQQKFPPNDELEFWYLYLKFIIRGGEIDNMKIEEIANNGNTLIPYFYLFSIDKKKYIMQAQQLFNQLKGQETEKSKYIISVMEIT